MATTRRSPRRIVRNEDVDGRITELLDRVDSIMGVADDEVPLGERRTPDFTDLLREDLKAYFEDEVIPAVPEASGGGYIDETELHHELAKKALVGLKLSRLREGAMEIGAPLTGAKTSEDVAAAIAKALGWDSEAVAKFVLEHEEEPSETSAAHGSRLYPLDDAHPESTSNVAASVQGLIGRYIRVDVARWYVFDDMRITDDGVSVTGKHMWFMADVDPTKDRAALRSVSKSDDVTALIAPSRKSVEIGNVAVRTARAAMFAVTHALLQQTLGYVPNAGSGAQRLTGTIHGSAEFLLSVLQDRLPSAGVVSVNLTVARFKADNGEEPTDENKPRLKAVRFEGNHILDSVPACRFLAVEGRPLVNVSFRMVLNIPDVEGTVRHSSFPVKIGLESDHVHVVTGLGDDPIGSRRAHNIVKAAVWAEISEGRPDFTTLDNLFKRISERAFADEESDEPSILYWNGDNLPPS